MRRDDFPPKRKSPLDDLYSSGASGPGSGGGPLDDLYGGSASGTPFATPSVATTSPLDDIYGGAAESIPGAATIAAQEAGNIKQNVDQLKALLQRPGISPAQRQRIEGMIKRYEEPSVFGFAVGNRVTDPNRGAVSNFARGAAAGAINYGLLGATDLALGAAQLALPKALENLIKLPEGRERVADAQQIIKEYFDPQGYAGGAGTVAGAIVPGFITGGAEAGAASKAKTIAQAVANPFHVLNTAGFKSLARLSPAAASIVAKGTKPGATFLQRLAAQWVGSSAIDAVQAADVLTNDQLSDEDKIKALVMTAVASGGAATAASLRKIKPTAAEIAELKRQARRGPAVPETPQEGAKPGRAAEADALAKKAAEKAEQAQVNRRLTRGARAEWEAQNLGKDWKKDLTDEQRTEIITKYKARYAKTNISPEDIKFSGQQIEHNLAVVKQHLPDLSPQQQEALATGLTNGEEWANTKLKELLAARKAAPAAGSPAPETPPSPPGQPVPEAPPAPAAEVGTLGPDTVDPNYSTVVAFIESGTGTVDAAVAAAKKLSKNLVQDVVASVKKFHTGGAEGEKRFTELVKAMRARDVEADVVTVDRGRLPAAGGEGTVPSGAGKGKAVAGAGGASENVIDVGPAPKGVSGYDHVISQIESGKFGDQEFPDGTVFKAGDEEYTLATGAGTDLVRTDAGAPRSQPSGAADILARLRNGDIYQNKGDVAEITQQIENLSPDEYDAFDRIYARLIGEFEAGTLKDEDVRLLQNLQATDIHMADRPPAQPPRLGEQDPTQAQPVTSPLDVEIERLQAELAQTRNQRDEARRQAETDPMTGLGNQGAWARAIAAADADPNLEIVSFDLQNVKAANEILGRTEADQYIIDAARAVETAARANDAGARVFRYGGDEFSAIVPKGKGALVLADAQRILGASSAGEYPLGIRGAVGETAAQADAAVNAIKAGEKGPKYRKVVQPATVEQLVPGVELKKPLAEHSVEELDALYDKIDKQFETNKITEEAYASGIVAISEAKRQLKARGVEVESLAPTKRGPQAGKPKVDQKAAVDAGYMPGELKSADPRVNEGYAFMDGDLKPVDRPALERIKTHYNAEIDRFEAARERLNAVNKDQLTAQEVDQVLGYGDNRGQSKGEVASFIERKIRGAKAEIDRFTRQHARYNEANPSAEPPPRANPADVTGAAVQKGTYAGGEVSREAKLAPELRKVTDPTIFKKQFTARVDKMSLPDLEVHRDDLMNRLAGMNKAEKRDSGYAERLAKVNEQIAKRAQGEGGVTLRTDPRVVGFAVGFSAGLVSPADDDQERFRNAMYFGAAGALGSHAVLRMLQRAKAEAVPDYQKEIREHVKSVEDAPLEHRKGIYSLLLEKYGNIARRDIGITAITKVAGGGQLPAGRNPGKLAEIFGFWRGMADRWLWGDVVGTYDRDGNWVQFDAMTMQQIAGMVEGDLRTVGDLAAARRELELRSMEEPRTTGLSLEAARKMYANTAEKYHLAADELTKFYRAMKDLSVMAGLLSKESSDKMDAQTFYVAVRRLFSGEPGTTPSKIDVKSKGKKKTVSKPEQMFKGLKGGRQPYQNPVEAAIDLLPRYHRAAELNRLTTEFFDMLSALPASDRALIGRRLSRAETPKIEGEDVKIQLLRDELASEGHHISEDEAHAFISALSDESLNVTNDIVRFYRNGKMEAWRVSEPIARAFKTLQPHELEMLMGAAGMLTKPVNLARVGITANPVFVGYQAFRDIWQYHMNGTYATQSRNPLMQLMQAPFSLVGSGIGSVRGWLHIMFNSGEYRAYANTGAGGESVASQGLQVIRGNVKKSTNVLERIKEAPAKNQFERIYKEIRTGNFREAYASILSPIADAGRIGAYLTERGRGADVVEAVYRAKKAGANFSNRGDATLVQALNRMTLFLNPAIQGLDASRYAFQKDPIGYVTRGIAGITIPSMLLWAAYKDDEEIVQLRSTPTGKKFWFYRLNGEIHKVPKPIFDGQVFGASAESWLDQRFKDDPDAVRNWAEAMYNDASVNLLPMVGVVPVSLMTGKVVGLGSDIVPPSTSGLDVEYRAKPNSSTVARIVSNAMGGPAARAIGTTATDNAFSPAGIDFLVQSFLGGLGSEAAQALSVAINLQQGGQMPPAEELPWVRAVFGQYPSMNTGAILEFYRHAEQSEQAANTLAHLARTKPEAMADYIEQRQQDIMLAEMYAKARNQIADLRRAMEDVRQAPREILDDQTRRELTKTFMEQMILYAKTVNDVVRTIDEHQSAEEQRYAKSNTSAPSLAPGKVAGGIAR